VKSRITALATIVLTLTVLAVSAQTQAPQPGNEQGYAQTRDKPAMSPDGPGVGYSGRFGAANSVGWKAQTHESELAGETANLVRRLAHANKDADKKELKETLEKVLGKQFDLRQQRHTLEIETLEAEVKRLKQLVQKRQESRSDIIAKKLDQLLQESEGLGW
jgi:hypothetical protein